MKKEYEYKKSQSKAGHGGKLAAVTVLLALLVCLAALAGAGAKVLGGQRRY